MGRQDEIVNERLKKIEALRKAKVNPYAYAYKKENDSKQLHEKYAKLKSDEKTKDKAKIAGRVMIIRDIGKLIFADLQDGTGKIQLQLQSDETPKKDLDFFKSFVDIGDFIGVEGSVLRTKRGELTILVKKVELLTKALLPLPEKFHGIADEEESLRKRYLDIITNPDVKELFVKKAKFWQAIRNFLLEHGFLEVETPVLETSAGGAAATPFKTHHNALDMDIYLRISMGELWQKKLMVAGYDKTFEIGRQFRNEGMDMEHLQDYTQMEFYWGYADYKDGMKLVEEMYKTAAKEVLGTLKFKSHGYDVDLGKKWELYDYAEIIKKQTKVDMWKATESEIKKNLDRLGQEYDNKMDKWRLVDRLWKYCRKNLAGPGFLINQPVELAPLAKRSRENPKVVEQFQVIIAGTELGNGYSELNDPIDQEERFKEQTKLKARGDVESMEHDESFVEALKYGMPPTCGFGVSERFFAYLVNKPVRECVIFPLMKPQNLQDSDGSQNSNKARGIFKPEAKETEKQEVNNKTKKKK